MPMLVFIIYAMYTPDIQERTECGFFHMLLVDGVYLDCHCLILVHAPTVRRGLTRNVRKVQMSQFLLHAFSFTDLFYPIIMTGHKL